MICVPCIENAQVSKTQSALSSINELSNLEAKPQGSLNVGSLDA
jgi:hypothetical protein